MAQSQYLRKFYQTDYLKWKTKAFEREAQILGSCFEIRSVRGVLGGNVYSLCPHDLLFKEVLSALRKIWY